MSPDATPAAETFGHEPVTADVGPCHIRGCQCPGHHDERVCARCATVQGWARWALRVDEDGGERWVRGNWPTSFRPVLWPCTSAIVLGLVPRPVPAGR